MQIVTDFHMAMHTKNRPASSKCNAHYLEVRDRLKFKQRAVVDDMNRAIIKYLNSKEINSKDAQ